MCLKDLSWPAKGFWQPQHQNSAIETGKKWVKQAVPCCGSPITLHQRNQQVEITWFKTLKLSSKPSCLAASNTQGVSQGSVLGLLLFLFNINSSPVELEAPQKCAIFARKTTATIPLYCQSDDLKKLWSALNTDKTPAMSWNYRNKRMDSSPKKQTTTSTVQTSRCLGITLDITRPTSTGITKLKHCVIVIICTIRSEENSIPHIDRDYTHWLTSVFGIPALVVEGRGAASEQDIDIVMVLQKRIRCITRLNFRENCINHSLSQAKSLPLLI